MVDARPSPAVTGLQSEMEIQDRNRKSGTRCRGGDPIDGIAGIGLSLSITVRQRFTGLWDRRGKGV
jgi:hypothetical protein